MEYPAPNDPVLLLDINETARRLGISRAKLYQFILDGSLRSIRIGRRRLVPTEALGEFLLELRQGNS